MSNRLILSLGQWARPTGILGGGHAPAHLTALAPLQPPRPLKHPLLMVPALGLPATEFRELGGHLASHPANGPVGMFSVAQRGLTDLHTGQATDAQRLFAIDYRDPNTGSSQKIEQLGAAVDEILSKKRASELTLLGHSAGSHDIRHFIRALGPQFPRLKLNVIAVGQGRNGLYLADLAKRFSPDHYGEAGRASPAMAQINDDWDALMGRVERFTFIGLRGAPTPVGRNAEAFGAPKGVVNRAGFATGDGYVPAYDLQGPGARSIILVTADPTPMSHRNVVRYSGVINAIQDTLGGQAS